MGETGPHALTHRRVAAEAGVPLAATTYWFTSKDELVAEAYRLAVERDLARVRAFADNPGDASRAGVAATLTRLLVDEIAGSRTALIAGYALWLEAARHPELRRIERDWTDAYLAVVQTVLARAGSPRPEIDARVIVAAIDGLLLTQLSDPDGMAQHLPATLGRLVEALFATP